MISSNSFIKANSRVSVSSKDMSTVLSKNMFQVISEFCNLSTLFILIKVNKKFRQVIKHIKIFLAFIEERKIIRNNITDIREIFDKYNPDASYPILLKNKLKIKNYTNLEIDHLVIEIMKIILIQLTKNGQFNLREYFLGRNSDSMYYLSLALKENNSIKILDLYNNSLGKYSDSMNYLSLALRHNNSISELNLYKNSIGSNLVSMNYLCLALKENKSITSLNLGSNNLGQNADSMNHLCLALKENKSINTLFLESNSLGNYPESKNYLSLFLKDNKTIRTLDLEYNSLGVYAQEELREINRNVYIIFEI